MSSPASRFDRGNGRPCPDCDYALAVLDRCRDACPTCGLIVPNVTRVRRLIKRRLGAKAFFLAQG